MESKKIGLWTATSIGIGGMIGAGIFSLLGLASQLGGNSVPFAFFIAGILALLNGYSYSKLSLKYPSAGGPVEFLIRGLGKGVTTGTLNIMLWVSYVTALALFAQAFGHYAVALIPNAPQYFVSIFAATIIAFFTLINFKGSKTMGKTEITIVTIKVLILLAFSLIGLLTLKKSFLSPSHWPATSSILTTTGVIFLAYEGFGLITNAAEDIENPKKNIPKALYYSILITMGVYILVSTTVLGNLPLPEIIKAQDYALAEAAKPFLGMIGYEIMAIAALFSTSSAINATLYGGANISYIIAKYGELPKIFDRKVWHNKALEGLFITSGITLILAVTLNLESIAMLGSATFLIVYAAVNTSHLKLYKKTKANPAIILTALIGCITSLIILIIYLKQKEPLTLMLLIIFAVASALAEAVYRKKTNRKIKERNILKIKI